MLSIFLSLFACILLYGAPRMIAGEERTFLPDAARRIDAYISSSSAQPEREAAESASGREAFSKRTYAASACAQLSTCLPVGNAVDSNGNVLHCGTYMRSVYQSFALGDGFA